MKVGKWSGKLWKWYLFSIKLASLSNKLYKREPFYIDIQEYYKLCLKLKKIRNFSVGFWYDSATLLDLPLFYSWLDAKRPIDPALTTVFYEKQLAGCYRGLWVFSENWKLKNKKAAPKNNPRANFIAFNKLNSSSSWLFVLKNQIKFLSRSYFLQKQFFSKKCLK